MLDVDANFGEPGRVKLPPGLYESLVTRGFARALEDLKATFDASRTPMSDETAAQRRGFFATGPADQCRRQSSRRPGHAREETC